MMSYKQDTEDKYWSRFLDWLKDGASFDPRNGEHIDTIFWWWWVNIGHDQYEARLSKEQTNHKITGTINRELEMVIVQKTCLRCNNPIIWVENGKRIVDDIMYGQDICHRKFEGRYLR